MSQSISADRLTYNSLAQETQTKQSSQDSLIKTVVKAIFSTISSVFYFTLAVCLTPIRLISPQTYFNVTGYGNPEKTTPKPPKHVPLTNDPIIQASSQQPPIVNLAFDTGSKPKSTTTKKTVVIEPSNTTSIATKLICCAALPLTAAYLTKEWLADFFSTPEPTQTPVFTDLQLPANDSVSEDDTLPKLVLQDAKEEILSNQTDLVSSFLGNEVCPNYLPPSIEQEIPTVAPPTIPVTDSTHTMGTEQPLLDAPASDTTTPFMENAPYLALGSIALFAGIWGVNKLWNTLFNQSQSADEHPLEQKIDPDFDPLDFTEFASNWIDSGAYTALTSSMIAGQFAELIEDRNLDFIGFNGKFNLILIEEAIENIFRDTDPQTQKDRLTHFLQSCVSKKIETNHLDCIKNLNEIQEKKLLICVSYARGHQVDENLLQNSLNDFARVFEKQMNHYFRIFRTDTDHNEKDSSAIPLRTQIVDKTSKLLDSAPKDQSREKQVEYILNELLWLTRRQESEHIHSNNPRSVYLLPFPRDINIFKKNVEAVMEQMSPEHQSKALALLLKQFIQNPERSYTGFDGTVRTAQITTEIENYLSSSSQSKKTAGDLSRFLTSFTGPKIDIKEVTNPLQRFSYDLDQYVMKRHTPRINPKILDESRRKFIESYKLYLKSEDMTFRTDLSYSGKNLAEIPLETQILDKCDAVTKGLSALDKERYTHHVVWAFGNCHVKLNEEG